jgi:cytochrome c556
MIRALSVAALLAVGATLAYAQGAGQAAVKQRQDLMKQQSNALKDPTAMMKGEAPFDVTKVKASLKTIQDAAAKLKPAWPDDSKSGDTAALPAVWEKKADFTARLDKLGADAKAAEAAIKDEATFKSEFKKVTDNCGGCHKEYRRPPQKK